MSVGGDIGEHFTTEPVEIPPGADEERETVDPAFRTLAELLSDPTLLETPDPIIKHLAYPGMALMLVGEPKAGKSELMAHACAALSNGRPFLGRATTPAHALWVGMEESLGYAVRRFKKLGAHPNRTHLLNIADRHVLESVRRRIIKVTPALVVVDSLAEFGRLTNGQAPDDGDNAAWGSVLRPLIALSHQHGPALSLIHHGRKSDGEYRGASEIAAAVDGTLTMRMPKRGEPPTQRLIRYRGREIGRGNFTVDLTAHGYGLVGGVIPKESPDADDELIFNIIRAQAGLGKTKLRELAGIRGERTDAAVNRLIQAGRVEDMRKGNAHHYQPAEPWPENGGRA